MGENGKVCKVKIVGNKEHQYYRETEGKREKFERSSIVQIGDKLVEKQKNGKI